MTRVKLRNLRPNNWYINGAKLEKVRQVWQRGQQDSLSPVLVTRIDGELSLIDGHSRAYAAFENGDDSIRAVIEDLSEIEGSRKLYEHIHREGPGIGIRTIADLKDRILDSDEHRRLWIGYCQKWLREHREEADV